MKYDFLNPRFQMTFRRRGARVALGAWLAFEALASGVPPTPIVELVRQADTVVHGRVASLETTRDVAGRLFTRVELEVAEVWKGGATNRFSLVLGSGVLGERRVQVSGEPEYRLGEEVVVFSVRNPAGDGVTLDLSQGKFGVTTDGSPSVKYVSNGVFGGPTAGSPARLPQQVPLTLKTLHEQVRRALTSAEGAQ